MNMKDTYGIASRVAKFAAPIFLMAAVLMGPAADAQRLPQASRTVRITTGDADAPHRLALPLNKAAIIELDRDARDVLVSNPDIADAVVRTPRRIFVLALKNGQTNAIFTDASGQQIANVEISVSSDVSDLDAAIERLIPGSKVKVESLNDNIVLDGTVASTQDAAKAGDLATRYAGSADKVINMLKIAQRQQVLIQVRVSEMSRTIAKQFGVDVAGGIGATSNGVPIIASTNNEFSLLGHALSDLSGVKIGNVYGSSGSCTESSTLTSCSPSPNNAQGVLRALEQIGLVHTLAEPNLTAVSGESAKFLAGGEFPVPTARDQYGNPVIEFKQYGVGLAFTPVVLSKGRISLQISTEVSELSTTGAIQLAGNSTSTTSSTGDTTTTTVAGLNVPGLTVRRTETTVELPSGGSLTIGGLMQKQTKQNIDAFPGLKDLPVLGALFRSRDFQNSETELVVMVTAYLVDPVNQKQIALPTDGFANPTDTETIVLGRLNAIHGKDEKPTAPSVAPNASVGYIVQ